MEKCKFIALVVSVLFSQSNVTLVCVFVRIPIQCHYMLCQFILSSSSIVLSKIILLDFISHIIWLAKSQNHSGMLH